jgi:hypothetical protein
MPYSQQRITLIARDRAKPPIDWNHTSCMRARIAFIDSIQSLHEAVPALEELGLDIDRIIMDRSADAAQFLSILASTPTTFGGDILMIGEQGTGFLSASGRGGDRQLHAVSEHDIRFYLEAHDLVASRVTLEKSA